MQYLQANLLSIITLLPALGALVLLFIPDADKRRTTFRYGALGVALLTFVLSLLLLPGFQSDGQLHYVIDLSWITTIGARYTLGVDGISIWLVLLNTLLFPLAI